MARKSSRRSSRRLRSNAKEILCPTCGVVGERSREAHYANYGHVGVDLFPNQMWTLFGPARDAWYAEQDERAHKMPRWRTHEAAEKVFVKLWRANRDAFLRR